MPALTMHEAVSWRCRTAPASWRFVRRSRKSLFCRCAGAVRGVLSPGAPRLRVARELDRLRRGAGSGTWWATAACTTPTCTRPRWRPPCGARTLMPTRSAARQARPGPHPLPGPLRMPAAPRSPRALRSLASALCCCRNMWEPPPAPLARRAARSQVQRPVCLLAAGAALPSLPSKPLGLPHHRP